METINHECYVSLEVAKLLKKAGFDWKCQYYIHAYTQEIVDSIKTHKKLYCNEDVDFSAPTLNVAQRWLREVKNLYIEIHRMPKCDLFDRYFTSIAIMQEPFDIELRDKDEKIVYISGKLMKKRKKQE